MENCKVCKLPVVEYDGFVHEFSFGSTLKTEMTHSGMCAEMFEESLQSLYATHESDDEYVLAESLENLFDDHQLLW